MIFYFSKLCLIDDYKRLYTPSNDIVNQPMQRDDTTGNTDQLGPKHPFFVQQTKFRKLGFFEWKCWCMKTHRNWWKVNLFLLIEFFQHPMGLGHHGIALMNMNMTRYVGCIYGTPSFVGHTIGWWFHRWVLAGGFTDGYGYCWVDMLSHSTELSKDGYIGIPQIPWHVFFFWMPGYDFLGSFKIYF